MFFDALLELFEGNNKIIYYKIIKYRHLTKNVVSTSDLQNLLINFVIQPQNYEKIKHQNILKDTHYDDETSSLIFHHLETLLNSCNTDNQKIIWKWVHNILNVIITYSGIEICCV